MAHKNRRPERLVRQMFPSACFENVPFRFTETWLNPVDEFEPFQRQCQANLINRVMRTGNFNNRLFVPECSFPTALAGRRMEIAEEQMAALSHDSRKLPGQLRKI